MLEMRALIKAAPYIQKEIFYTGNDTEDQQTRESVDEFFQLLQSYPYQFDETQLFTVRMVLHTYYKYNNRLFTRE